MTGKQTVTDRDILLIDRALAYAIAVFERLRGQIDGDGSDARDMRRLLEARVGKYEAERLIYEAEVWSVDDRLVK